MDRKALSKTLTFFIALVWIINGFGCKILNLVPRHEMIVARILGDEHSRILTVLIGISELVMAIWILSKYKSKANATMQIIIVLVMNVLEILLVPDLLLWGNLNFVFALFFIGIVYYNTFVLGTYLPNKSK